MELRDDYIVEKTNILNDIRYDGDSMTLQQLRFLSIYLSKINSRNLNTRVVKFAIKDFQKIMDLTRINIEYLKTVTNSLLSKVVNIPHESSGYIGFQLFKECKVAKNKNGEWYVEIEAHDRALPLMFEFKDRYFTYNLGNILSLKSSNQLRMYEILKQYEKIGSRIIDVEELRLLLGLSNKEYSRYSDFRERIIKACQKALEENTDIKFNFEPYGKKGKSGKILKLKFIITKNENYKDNLTLDKFILNSEDILDVEFDFNTKKVEDEYSRLENLKSKFKNKYLFFYSETCNHEFNEKELQVLYNLVIKIIPNNINANIQTDYYDYLKSKYDELNLKSTKKHISNRFGYIKKLIKLDLEFN